MANPIRARILSGLLTLLAVAVWYAHASEAEPWSLLPGDQESSRFRTLRHITEASNNGYYFQLEPGIPMETHWEDPGAGFMLVCWGMLKRLLGLGPLHFSSDPYRVELFVILLPLALIFFTRFFSLPRWYWWVAPIFFLLAALPFYTASECGLSHTSGLLPLSISTRWAKVPAAFWAFTVTVQFLEWWKEETLFLWAKRRVLFFFIGGVVSGILISVRKDIAVSIVLAVAGTLMLFVFLEKNRNRGWEKIGLAAAFLGILFLGIFAVQESITLSWKIRDTAYPMKDYSRIYGHPVWHSLYASLGKIKADKEIRWGDADAWQDVSSLPENKEIRYGTVEHERAARKLYFQTISRYPLRFIFSVLKKTAVLIRGNWKLVGVNFLLLLAILYRLPGQRALCFVMLVNTLASMIVPAFVIPDIIYSYDFRAYNYLAFLVGVGILADSALNGRLDLGFRKDRT